MFCCQEEYALLLLTLPEFLIGTRDRISTFMYYVSTRIFAKYIQLYIQLYINEILYIYNN